jgi:hypothetical protein
MSVQTGRFLAAGAASVALFAVAAPAQAGKVIVVQGDRAVKREDPLVPSRAATDLPAPPRRSAAARAASGSAAARAASASSRARASSRRGRRAVARALRQAVRARRISRARYRRYLRAYRRARSVARRLRGARRAQLGYVIGSIERMALRGRLVASRMPALFVQLERNTQYWPSKPYPGSRDDVVFRGSELLFRYFPGRGLQLHPLANFKKANLMHGACKGVVAAPCRPGGLRRLLDELSSLAVRRGRGFVAWEYLFDFGGGAPPWMSGMAQASAVQALGRASELLSEPRYRAVADRALGAFEVGPPAGVRTVGPGGSPHYLHYSFASRFYVFNGFLQALIGLHDYGGERAARLYAEAEPEAMWEVPASDVGDWSRYSFRGRESTREYHELLREFLQSMCNRRLGGLYCDYARRYRGYQTEPAQLELLGPEAAMEEQRAAVRFNLSKLAAVEIRILKGDRVAFHRIATFRRGGGAFTWRPRSPGLYTVRLGAKELRTGLGLRTRDAGEVEVADDPDR